MTSLFEKVRLGFQGREEKIPSPFPTKPVVAPKQVGETFVIIENGKYIVRTSDPEVIALIRTYAGKTGKTITEDGAYSVLKLPLAEGRNLQWPQKVLARIKFGQQAPETSTPAIEGKLTELGKQITMPSPFSMRGGQ